jgi:prepilin-type N-terminal cleavage/methylation domain-containing protein
MVHNLLNHEKKPDCSREIFTGSLNDSKLRKKSQGFTLIEILIVLTVVSITFTIGAIGSKQILTKQENLSAMRSIKQLFWQGATNAASRSVNLELTHYAQQLTIRPVGGTTLVREATLPNGFSTNLPNGIIATFTSPGKVKMAPGISNTFTVSFDGKTYNLTISQIGEVLEVAQ